MINLRIHSFEIKIYINFYNITYCVEIFWAFEVFLTNTEKKSKRFVKTIILIWKTTKTKSKTGLKYTIPYLLNVVHLNDRPPAETRGK